MPEFMLLKRFYVLEKVMFFLFQRRISLSAIKSKKNFPSFTTPTSARNFSSVFVRYENTQHSRILDNYRVRLSSKDIKDVRHFSISIVKFQDVGGSTVSESVSTESTSSISSGMYFEKRKLLKKFLLI